ncbi:MAG: enoyl-CoA hydratase-related protein [Bacteroidota bacterium]
MIYTKKEVANFQDQVFAYLQTEEKNHVFTILLNRPEKKNAMNQIMMNEIAFALSYTHYNNDIWAVVIEATGDVFCAGLDLKALPGQKQPETNSTIPIPLSTVLLGELFTQMHKPCIAKVDARVYAGAFLIICGCTHVVATDNATFCLPEVKRGIWPMQVMQSLLNIMPARKALDLCMLGNTLSSREAYDIGLVTSIVSSDKLDDEVSGLTRQICSNSPAAIRYGLKAYDEMRAIDHSGTHRFLREMLNEVLKTEDAKEGILAFKEKRKPEWTGK